MIFKMYSIFDSKAEVYLPPFYQKTHGESIRTVTESVTNSDSMLSKHPGDFTLYYLGDFDDETGLVAPLKTHLNLGKLLEFQARAQSEVSPLNAMNAG